MKKQTDKAFGKKVFLLGKDSDGIKYWLEEPKWDCEWYWGFGYIETYQGNQTPSKARDISSHQHAEDFYPKWTLSGTAILQDTTFLESEAWELAELFQTFYHLKEQAEFYGRGKMNISNSDFAHEFKDVERAKKINEKMIPKITARIMEILTPRKEGEE